MSKIAEKIHNVALQKAEEYSKTHSNSIIEEVAYGRGYKTAYIECYDQAFQDFMEKAERYLQNTLYDRVEIEVYGTVIPNIIGKKGFIENFKNYMQDEM
jgi:hypothetical protein